MIFGKMMNRHRQRIAMADLALGKLEQIGLYGDPLWRSVLACQAVSYVVLGACYISRTAVVVVIAAMGGLVAAKVLGAL